MYRHMGTCVFRCFDIHIFKHLHAYANIPEHNTYIYINIYMYICVCFYVSVGQYATRATTPSHINKQY